MEPKVFPCLWTGFPPGFSVYHTPIAQSAICKSSLELLSPHLSRACTFPSPTGFAYWVSGDFDSFPPLHQHLHSLSYHHLSSGLARDTLHLISNLVLFFSHSFVTPQALWTTVSTVHHCTTLLHAVATLIVLIPRDKPHSPCLLLLPLQPPQSRACTQGLLEAGTPHLQSTYTYTTA